MLHLLVVAVRPSVQRWFVDSFTFTRVSYYHHQQSSYEFDFRVVVEACPLLVFSELTLTLLINARLSHGGLVNVPVRNGLIAWLLVLLLTAAGDCACLECIAVWNVCPSCWLTVHPP